ncbi:MAG TPA: hypothetical protein ENN76_01210 [Euryarchaeota archaeon]|nr:hypothetical protein [Euryarchaeota archaeon]
MNAKENGGTAAPANDKPAADTNRATVPNNLDHIAVSGLMEGSFSGPFEMDFEGNHTLIIGANGQVTLYRASRTSPVAFIARDAKVHISSGMVDCDMEVHAQGPGGELTVTVQDLSGINIVPVDSKWLSLEKGILEAAYDLEGKFGRRRMGKILAGSNTVSTIGGTTDDLRLFGRFRRYSVSQVVAKLDEMLNSGLLEFVNETTFPTVNITSSGEERMLELRKELGTVDLAFGDPDEDSESTPYVAALKEWRTKKCQEDNAPPYIVLRNDAIKHLAKKRPADIEQLSEIRGVGPSTLERYGEEIISILKAVEV